MTSASAGLGRDGVGGGKTEEEVREKEAKRCALASMYDAISTLESGIGSSIWWPPLTITATTTFQFQRAMTTRTRR